SERLRALLWQIPGGNGTPRSVNRNDLAGARVAFGERRMRHVSEWDEEIARVVFGELRHSLHLQFIGEAVIGQSKFHCLHSWYGVVVFLAAPVGLVAPRYEDFQVFVAAFVEFPVYAFILAHLVEHPGGVEE